MEPRKIVIVSTKTQSKYVITTAATTLGELKKDLRNNDIDYRDMDFFEGTAKVQLKTDDSILPHDVPYKGTITNDLVIMLTTMNKKIKSGTMTRAEAYAKVKEMGIQNFIKEKFGKNFTQCSTADIISVIDAMNTPISLPKKSKEVNNTEDDKNVNHVEEIEKEISKQLVDNVSHIELEDIVQDLSKKVEKLEERVKALEEAKKYSYEDEDEEEYENECPYSNDDIDDMFDFIKN